MLMIIIMIMIMIISSSMTLDDKSIQKTRPRSIADWRACDSSPDLGAQAHSRHLYARTWSLLFILNESRVRLKGYGGPFQSSETIMTICYFISTLFNSSSLAYYSWQPRLRLIHCDLKPENILIKSYSRSPVRKW